MRMVLSKGLDLVLGTRRNSHYAPLPRSLQADCHKGTTPIVISGAQKGGQLQDQPSIASPYAPWRLV
jgi:hypothetical protein